MKNIKEIKDYPIENMPIPAQREYLHEAYNETELCEFIKDNMSKVFNPWHTAYLIMERVYKIPLGSAQTTDSILQLDAQRDQIAHAIDVAVEAALKSIDPAMVSAAKALQQTKVSFPVDPKKGYLYQTAQIDLYVRVMLDEQQDNATKVGVLALVQNLKAVNDQVHVLIAERGNERVEKNQEPTRPEARQAAIDAFRLMIKYINGYNLVVLGDTEPNQQLNLYIDTMNEKGKRFRSIYLHGAGNHTAEDSPANPDGSDNPNPTPPEGEENIPEEDEQNPNPETPNPNPEPENPGNGDNNGTTTDPNDPWYNPDDEPD